MVTLTTRSGKGLPLTNEEMDANLSAIQIAINTLIADGFIAGLAPVQTVAGRTGTVVLTKADVGLGNVDNTSDANKPISTATQTALNEKQAALISAVTLKTVNGVSLLGSGDVSTAGITIQEYDSRDAVRSMSPAGGTQIIIRGLGLFSFVSGSTEYDDDSTCFATASGRWLLDAISHEFLDAAIDDAKVELRESFPIHFLFSEIYSSVVSLSAATTVAITGTVTGARVGNAVIVNPQTAPNSKVAITGRVTVDDTVAIYLCNTSDSPQVLTTGYYNVLVIGVK